MFTKFITKIALAFAIAVGLAGVTNAGSLQISIVANGGTSCFDQSIFFNNDVPRRGTIKTSKNKVERTCDTVNGVAVYGVVHAKGKTHPVNACNRAGTRCWLDESVRAAGGSHANDNHNNWETDDGQEPVYSTASSQSCSQYRLHTMPGVEHITSHGGNGDHRHKVNGKHHPANHHSHPYCVAR